MQDILRPRRIAVAVAIFVTLGAIGTAAAGAEFGHIEAGPLPDAFHLSAAKVGDRGTFTLDIVRVRDEKITVETSHEALSFTWHAPIQRRDADGRLHEVNVYETQEWWLGTDGNWEQSPTAFWNLDVATRRPILHEYLHNFSRQVNFEPTSGKLPLTDCISLLDWQDREIPLKAQFDLLADCGLPSYWVPRGFGFTAQGIQTINGAPTLLLSGRRADIHVWLSSELPVPIRLVQQDQHDPSRFFVFRLTRFAHGEGAAIAWNDRTLPSDPLPAIQTATWNPIHGMDDSQIDHPFTLRKAMAQVGGESTKGMRQLLDEGGYVGMASASHRIRDGTESWDWWVQVVNGGKVCATTIWMNRGPIDDVIPVVGMAYGSHEETYFGTGAEQCQEYPDPFPPASMVQAQVPTVASMEERWRAVASERFSGLPLTTWGHFVAGDGSIQVTAGVDNNYSWNNRTNDELGPLGPFYKETTEAANHRSELRWNIEQDGRTNLQLSESQFPTVSSPAPPWTSSPASAQEIVLPRTPVWFDITTATLLGGGLLGALAGLLYFFAPVLKGGLFGLFSRVTSPGELVQHPKRSSILALVEAEPGIHLREVQRRLCFGRNQLDHHVGKLLEAGVVKRIAGPGYTCLFPANTDRRDTAAAGVTKSDGARRLLRVVASQPGLGVREAARRSGLSLGTASHHVKRLREAGLLADGGGLSLTETGSRAAAA